MSVGLKQKRTGRPDGTGVPVRFCFEFAPEGASARPHQNAERTFQMVMSLAGRFIQKWSQSSTICLAS
jgi:hypothetical protein